MKNLKMINPLFLILVVLISSCQTSQKFKMTALESKELYIVETDSNRIIQECYFMNAEKENAWRHQYILNMLDQNNEVIPVYYPTNQGKSECLAHFKKIDKILKLASRVRLCARDKLEKITDGSTLETHDFGSLGRHESPYHALTFDTICNSKECHSISDTWTYTCPDFQKKSEPE